MRSSSSSTASTTQTTVNNYDQRTVTDNTGGILGSGNSVDNSIAVTSAATGGIVGSGNSVTYTDAGAVNASMEALTKSLQVGFSGLIDLGGQQVQGVRRAFDSADEASANSREIALRAFDLASETETNSRDAYADALSYADSALNAATNAYKTSADSMTGNRTVIVVAMAVVGIVGAGLLFLRKGRA